MLDCMPQKLHSAAYVARRTFSEAHRVKLRAAWEARRERGLSEETKERMRQAKLGHTTSAGGFL